MTSFTKNSRLVVLILSLLMAVPYSFIALSIVNVSFPFILLISTVIFYLTFTNLKLIRNRELRILYMIISILKLGLLIYITYAKPGFLAGVDWYNFNNYALAAVGDGGNIADIYNRSLDLFVFMMAITYKIFGPLVDQIYFIIFALSLLVFRYVFKTVRLIGGTEKLSIIAGLVVMLWPVNIIFSSSLVREIPIQLAGIVSFYLFVKYLKQRKGRALLLAYVFGIAAAMMHSGMIALVLAYTYVLFQGKLSKKRKIISLSALILVSVFATILLMTPAGSSVLGRFSGIDSINDINQQFEFQLEANTTYITATPSSFGELALSVPYRLAMFAVAPLPWQVNSFTTFLSFLIDGLLQIVLIVLIYKSLKRSKYSTVFVRNVVVTGVLCIFITYLLFSLGTNNYGSAMRHRAKVLPIAVVLVSTLQIMRKSKENENNLEVKKAESEL